MQDESQVQLVACSDLLSGNEIADALALNPVEIVIKGSPTGKENPSQHPCHIVCFSLPLNKTDSMERQIEAMVEFAEQKYLVINELSNTCKFTVYCLYRVIEYGGWTISADLHRQMGKYPFEYVFAVEVLKQEK